MTVSRKPHRLWNVPYQRNMFFTERDDALRLLHRELQARDAIALTQPQAITGLGGIGKTQMALEYAYRYGTAYTAVLWVRAASTSELISSFVELASVLNLPERHQQDQNLMIDAVQRWLRRHTDWLLIFDNMDDLSAALEFLPKAGTGHLLFTTRAQALGNIAQCVEVQPMKPEIGALLLLHRAELLPLHAPLKQAKKEDDAIAREISRELNGLPLALDQAGAYISATRCSLRDYLMLYETRRQDVLRERGSFNQDYLASVATTWSLSFEKVKAAQPAAAELLNFCAFLAPDAIPETIITGGASYLGNVLAPMVADPTQFDLLSKEILKYSLIQREPDTGTLSMHRLVQAVLRDGMPAQIQEQWMQCAMQAVAFAYPEENPDLVLTNWPLLEVERLLPHALMCVTWIEQASFTTPVAGLLLNNAAYYLENHARYREAEPLYQRGLAISEQQLGDDHPVTAKYLNNLAGLYQSLGRYEEAEPLYQRSLAIREQQEGNEHLSTASCLNNLAHLYCAQGRYREAELLYKRALAIFEQQLGDNHFETVGGLNNLAQLYHMWGCYKEVEPLYQRALAVCEQYEHPHTATLLNNLGGIYQSLGRYGEAELLYQRALNICEQQWGDEHPSTAEILNNLANLYCARKRYREAEPLHQRVLMIFEQQLGDEHPHTTMSLNNLAELYREQGRYREAEPLYQRALMISEQQLGEEHPDMASHLNNLAALYQSQGRYREAEKLYKRAIAVCERQLGNEHPNTAKSLSNLAGLYGSRGRWRKAASLYARALSIFEDALGARHPTTITVRTSYTLLLRAIKHSPMQRIWEEILNVWR